MSIEHLDNDSVTSDHPQPATTTTVDKPIQRFKNLTNELPKYTIIWIDENINDTEENLVIQEKLRSGINQLKVFNNLDAGVDYLTDVENQKIVLIISNTYGCHMIPHIHEFTKLKAIYIHRLDKKISTNWSKNYDKVKGVFQNYSDLIDTVSTHQRIREGIDCNPLTINFYSTARGDESTSEERQSKNTMFMYFQLFVDILLKMDTENRDLSGRPDLVDSMLTTLMTKPLDATYKQALIDKLLETLIQKASVDASVKQQQIDALRRIQLTSSSSSSEDSVIQLLLTMRPNSSRLAAKEDLINHFKEIYQDNTAQELLIVEFEKKYRQEKAIEWYTRPSFLYQTLNKALRELDYEVLLALRFFIADLHKQLTIEHVKFLQSLPFINPVFCVYRGHTIEVKEVNFMRRNIGQFLSMQSFLSTSTDRQVALMFAESSASPDAHIVHILFQFNIDTRLINTKPYANIKNLSYFPDEKEVLIGLGAIFRIDTVEYSDFEQTWIAVLTLCSEDNFELKDLMKQTKDEVIGGITSLGRWLVRRGEYEKAKNYLEQIRLNPSISKYERVNCYRALGNTASGQKEYDKALQNYEHMLELLVAINDQEKIGIAYKSIGEVHWFKKNLGLALDYEQRALNILLPMNHRELADVYAIIGNIYLDNDDCVSAKEYFEKSLEVDRQHGIPEDHPNFGVTYECIGVAYYKSSEYKRALEYYAKAMQVWQKSLPPSHPNFLVLTKKINITKAKMNEK